MCNLCNGQDTLMWYKKTSKPSTGIISSGYFLIDSNYYVIGGLDSFYDYYKEVWKYNIAQDNWQKLNDFPFTPIAELTAFAINGKGYICTGLDSISSYGCDTLMWEYDPHIDSWLSRASFPGSKREKASSFTYNNKAYVGLGYACGGPVTDLWEYDPITNKWSMLDSFPSTPRYGSALTILDSILYVIGGIDINDSLYSETWSYNIVNNQWRQLANLPGGGRRYPLAFSFNNFFLAGYGDLGIYDFANDLYRYNINHDSWDTIVSLNLLNVIAGNSYFVYGKSPYFFAGLNDDTIFSHDMWTADASSLFAHRDTTGIATVQDQCRFRLYPTVVSSSQRLNIQSSERGDISFYDELGQLVYISHLDTGTTTINYDDIHRSSGMLLYHAILYNGKTESGKVILY
jgi:N-acetylneuraminic acid mutarotase